MYANQLKQQCEAHHTPVAIRERSGRTMIHPNQT